MISSLKVLSAIMFGIVNVMGADLTGKIKELYAGLENNRGDISPLKSWMNKIATNMNYCDMRAPAKCGTKRDFELFTQYRFFSTKQYLLSYKCDVTSASDDGLSMSIACDYKMSNLPDFGCTQKRSTTAFIQYDPNGQQILQYFLYAETRETVKCETFKPDKPVPPARRLMGVDLSGKIKELYAGLENNRGDISPLKTWMNKIAINMNYCDMREAPAKCGSKRDFEGFTQYRFFSTKQYLLSYTCDATSASDALSTFIACDYYMSNLPDFGCTQKRSTRAFIQYDPNGQQILQYFLYSETRETVKCEEFQPDKPPARRLIRSPLSHQTSDVCYNTNDKNPCTSENIANGNYFFRSCSGCCYFIQCAEENTAVEMTCGAGTFWDQKINACAYNTGQCQNQCSSTPKPKPISAPTISTNPPTTKTI